MSQKLAFSGIFLTKDDKTLDIEEFKRILPADAYSTGGTNNAQAFDLSYDRQYLKINFGGGSSMPRNPVVINTDTKEREPNPRQQNQVESRQTFAIIDFDQGFLWLSNTRKRKMLIDFLSIKFINQRIITKNVYDEQKFIDTIKRLDDLKISAAPDLFSQTNTLSAAMADVVNQYEAVIAELHFEYENKIVGEGILEKIKSIINNKRHFRGIVIAGRDEKGLGMLFNTDEISRRIVIRADVDNNEMFSPEEVFEKLISTVQDEKKI